LLNRRNLVGSFLYGYRRADVRSATAVYYTIVLDEVANGTDSIVQGTLRLVDNLGRTISGRGDLRYGKLRTILLLPRTKMVTARVLAHFSMTIILSRVVPNVTSRTIPAFPSFCGVKSSNRGTMRPSVAIAIS
jgi:hypothetical protein